MPNERCLPYEPHSRHVSNVLYPMVLSMSAKLHRLTRDMPSRLSIRKETNLSIKNKEVNEHGNLARPNRRLLELRYPRMSFSDCGKMITA